MGVTPRVCVCVCVVCGRCTEPSCSNLGVRASRGVIWPKALVRASPGDFPGSRQCPDVVESSFSLFVQRGSATWPRHIKKC